ncbi:uncharacterized protein LOC110415425 isoform X2 [Herrania umbratica]|uniref:Uncharacterized protein LOC110415425 isoform X2 n=1 Tax=Herrania umbratica TaxID=108875 RepID=A0A6J1A7S5_9ROSI|nr:uncharacterized protein LOC110415425 isoform X2 [Herrania umbratica]
MYHQGRILSFWLVAMTLGVNVNKCSKKKRGRVAYAEAFRKVRLSTLIVGRRRQSSRRRIWQKRRLVNKKMVTKLMQLKMEMEEIREQQSFIKEGQRKVKERFEAVESECRNLHAETMIIMKQSVWSRLRLGIMFQILKARENNDFAKAAELTLALRELIARQNQNEQALEPSAGASGK